MKGGRGYHPSQCIQGRVVFSVSHAEGQQWGQYLSGWVSEKVQSIMLRKQAEKRLKIPHFRLNPSSLMSVVVLQWRKSGESGSSS